MTWEIDDRFKVLFVCIGNMCRSPMAEGFARAWGDDIVDPHSAGLNPTGVVSEDSIEVMGELGIDISGQSSQGLKAIPMEDIDLVVNITGRPATSFVPALIGDRVVDWGIPDPIGRSVEEYRRVRDLIADRVRELLDDVRSGRWSRR